MCVDFCLWATAALTSRLVQHTRAESRPSSLTAAVVDKSLAVLARALESNAASEKIWVAYLWRFIRRGTEEEIVQVCSFLCDDVVSYALLLVMSAVRDECKV